VHTPELNLHALGNVNAGARVRDIPVDDLVLDVCRLVQNLDVREAFPDLRKVPEQHLEGVIQARRILL
jgi:hypothetical protein